MRNPSLPDALQQYLDYLAELHYGDGKEDGDYGMEVLPPAPYVDPWMDLPPDYEYDPSFTEWVSGHKDLLGILRDTYERYGAPAIQNPDGTRSTEESITVTEADIYPGGNRERYVNIPTIWAGRRLSEEEAIRKAMESELRFPTFDSVDAAVEAAILRSEQGGAGTFGFLGTPRDENRRP